MTNSADPVCSGMSVQTHTLNMVCELHMKGSHKCGVYFVIYVIQRVPKYGKTSIYEHFLFDTVNTLKNVQSVRIAT